ncbi:MAG TPA: TauD/TfdA family dioxygenase [Burkholderiales bacterium]|jgi:taurine dioxygenase|nr:TauD/TfdA family dioxygenase [Burkholderiales bacterium]
MINVTRMGKHCGAEISGVDLSKPLSDAQFEEVSKAFFDNEVVVFRDQKLTPDQQIAFTRRFGILEEHVRKESRLAGHPEILIISNLLDDNGKAIGSQDAGRYWHSDLSYARQPSMLSALYSIEVPEADGIIYGDTGFASTIAAYEALPEEMKREINGVKNVHSYRFYRQKNYRAQQEEKARGGRTIQEHAPTEEQLARVPDMETPIVRTHPVTGKKGLFVNEAHTSHIPGIDEAKSTALLNKLYAHLANPEFIYRHGWRPGDLLMWDNCAVQHKATFDYDLPLRRLMYRTTVRGTQAY